MGSRLKQEGERRMRQVEGGIGEMLGKSLYQTQAEIFKALAHPTRVMIVSAIAESGSKCVCELADKSGFDQSTISKHLALLKSVGILKSSKEGLNVRYEINMPCVVQLLRCTESVFEGSKDSEDITCKPCKQK